LMEAFLVADEKNSRGGAGRRMKGTLHDRFGGRIPPHGIYGDDHRPSHSKVSTPRLTPLP